MEPLKWLTANIYRLTKTLEEEFKMLQLGTSDGKSIKRTSVWKCALSWWQMGGLIRTDCFSQITSDTCLRPPDYSVQPLPFPVISSTACTVHEVLYSTRQMFTPDQIRYDFGLLHGSVNQTFALLRCYVGQTGSYRCFETICRYHLQGSRSQTTYWTAWPLKTGQTGCPETSVTTNLRSVNIPEQTVSQVQAKFLHKYFTLQFDRYTLHV